MGDCSCFVVDDNGDMPKRFKEEYRRARKSYWCDECGGEIKKGDRYQYVRGLWYDAYDTWRTCIGCINIIEECFCSRPIFGNLNEWYRDLSGVNLDGTVEDDDTLFPCPPDNFGCSHNGCGECWYEYWDSKGYDVIEDKFFRGEPIWLLSEKGAE